MRVSDDSSLDSSRQAPWDLRGPRPRAGRTDRCWREAPVRGRRSAVFRGREHKETDACR